MKYREKTSEEVLGAIEDSLMKIVPSVKQILEKTPPELAADIIDKRIVMAGGGSLIRKFPELISKHTHPNVIKAEDLLLSVVKGAGMALDKIDVLRKK